jgi:hypothetical protein
MWCMYVAPFGITLIPNSAPHTHTHTNTDLIIYAATPPNQPQRCILTDYFNNYNFSKLKQYAPWWWWLNRNM